MASRKSATLDKPKFTPDTLVRIPLTEIVYKENFNIRTETNVKKVSDIYESIKNIGIQEPITVNQDGVLVDGNRRYHCLNLISKETEEIPVVPVKVIHLDEKDIAAYQYRTGLRKNYTGQEKQKAIYEHARLNPEDSDTKIAELFEVSKVTVHFATKIIRANQDLTELVVGSLITQNAALDIVNSVLGDTSLDKITPAQDKKLSGIAQSIKPSVVEDQLKKSEEEGGNFKPWTLRQINASLNSKGIPQIEKPKAEKKERGVKLNAVLEQVLETLTFISEGDAYTVNGTIPKDLLETLQRAIKESKEGKLETSTYNEEDFDGLETSHRVVWQEFEKKFDGLVFVQISSVKYATYEQHIDIATTHTHKTAQPDVGETSVLVLTKTELNALIKTLVVEGINVLKVNKQKKTTENVDENKINEIPNEQIETETEEEEVQVQQNQNQDQDLGLDVSLLEPETEELEEKCLEVHLEDLANNF